MLSKEEIAKIILNTETHIHPLLNEIYAIRDRRKETQDYTIYVDGYISVDVLDKTLQLEKSDRSKEQSLINYYNEINALEEDLDEAWEEWNNLNEYCNQELQKRNKKIKQLETKEQKLIEKLEKRRKQNNNRYGQAIDSDDFPEMYEYSGQVKEDDYILSMIKGEEKNGKM